MALLVNSLIYRDYKSFCAQILKKLLNSSRKCIHWEEGLLVVVFIATPTAAAAKDDGDDDDDDLTSAKLTWDPRWLVVVVIAIATAAAADNIDDNDPTTPKFTLSSSSLHPSSST